MVQFPSLPDPRRDFPEADHRESLRHEQGSSAEQDLAPGRSEPIRQATRIPEHRRRPGRHRAVAAGALLTCDLSDHTSLNRGTDPPYHQRTGVGGDDENLNDFSYDEYRDSRGASA
jgi:hypothetical protein